MEGPQNRSQMDFTKITYQTEELKVTLNLPSKILIRGHTGAKILSLRQSLLLDALMTSWGRMELWLHVPGWRYLYLALLSTPYSLPETLQFL